MPASGLLCEYEYEYSYSSEQGIVRSSTGPVYRYRSQGVHNFEAINFQQGVHNFEGRSSTAPSRWCRRPLVLD
eukprot:scaffold341190_cov19-Prasinocladus_malaysianus.AAC.1